MEYKNKQEMNKRLKTTNIKGKDYVEVNERIKAFWELCPDGRIYTEILKMEAGECTIKASIYENVDDEKPRSTGIAWEKEGSTFINKSSYVENCETSAVGRALGNFGLGIDTSVASAEEVLNAMENQKDKREWQVDNTPLVSTEQAQILKKTVEKYNLSEERVKQILSDYNYNSFEEVKMSDFAKIGNALSK